MKDFAVGDHVHIARIGTGVVREVRNGGRYLVEVKGRSMVVSGDHLESARSISPKRKAIPSRDSPDTASRRRAGGNPPSLDLHGKTVPESLDALDAFVNDAILDGHAEVAIVHGRSGGRVKAAVHERLRETSAVRSFRLDPRNPGVTIVTF